MLDTLKTAFGLALIFCGMLALMLAYFDCLVY